MIGLVDVAKWVSLRWEKAEPSRYYEARLRQNLWGEWEIQLVWGGIGTRLGRVSSTPLASYEEGLKSLEKIRKRREQRGYVLLD